MAQPRILVVDGNETTRRTFRVALETAGYEVVEAETGEGALRAFADASIGLVLLDCRLPDMAGTDMARRLRDTAMPVPVVAVSGWAQAHHSAMLTVGFVEVLVKPIVPSQLVDVVRHHLGQAPSSAPVRGKRALVIEDDPTQRRLVSGALVNAGFDVITAENGEAGIGLAREQLPDVVLTDVLMPAMDGFEVCRAFRSDPELARVPIVLMSAHSLEDEDRELGTLFGASGYVSRASGLEAVVEAVVAGLGTPPTEASERPPWDLREPYLRRVVQKLERQAALSSGFARRAPIQATAMSILGSISDALARNRDPECALGETLTQCLDAAGLSVGAILLFGDDHRLAVRAAVGIVEGPTWARHAALLETALKLGSLTVPSAAAGPGGAALLSDTEIAAALVVPIVGRDEPFGVLVLGSNAGDFSGADGASFARAVGSVSTQLGHALSLGRLFTRLVAAEQRYRGLFDNARDAISILSPEGVVIEMNQRWEEIIGLPRNELIGRHISEFVPEGHTSAVVSAYQAAVTRGGGSVAPTPIRRSDGGVVHLEFSRTVVEVGGQKLVFAIGRDVGDRLRLADQLRAAQKLEAVGRLAGGVAHDMNNVLGVVLTYAQLLEDALPNQDPRRADATEIKSAAERGAGLTRQLLAFSRQQVVQTRVLDLNTVVRGLQRMLETLVGAHVRIVTRLSDALPPVRVDSVAFEQVLMNLAVNARDALLGGGSFTIGTEVEGGRVLLTVSDTGAGMAAETLSHVFEPFFTTKGIGKGTGLGLATVFGIVKQSGGDIEVDSQLGHGTTFRIYLPIAEETEGAGPPSRPERLDTAHAPPCNETIVVVEDEAALRKVIVRVLRDLGYHVISAATGPATLEECAAFGGHPHLLLTDVVLPALSGPEIARRLRQQHPDMKVLFVSGYTDATAYKDVPVGGKLFLQKPFAPQTLATRVREVLNAATADVCEAAEVA